MFFELYSFPKIDIITLCKWFCGKKSLVSNIPYVKYDDFTEEQCKEIQKQVMYKSKYEYGYNEVSVVYNQNNVYTNDFLVNPSVKILSVVNKEGEIAFLSKSKNANY